MISEDDWNNIEWLFEARELLQWLGTLTSGPAILMVRHSERFEDIDVPTTIQADLTERGHEIAFEFGKRLSDRWCISLLHSPHIRTTQTAQEIMRGFQEKSESIELEELGVLLGGRGDIERIVTLAHEIGFDEFYHHWTQDKIPRETIEPIEPYLQRLSKHIESRFSKAGENDLHIYVTHDIVIAATRRNYLDLTEDVGLAIPFLGGYAITSIDGELKGFNKGKEVKVTRNLFT
ncbi:MAG: histidine phosphatase family protein [Candidatus Thorarchaeota archaeon]